jgi:hypothetical protein
MWMPESAAVSFKKRACHGCEKEELRQQPIEEEEELQTKATSGYISKANPNLESRPLKGGGQPLSENDRAFFELRFGNDFSRVQSYHEVKAMLTGVCLDCCDSKPTRGRRKIRWRKRRCWRTSCQEHTHEICESVVERLHSHLINANPTKNPRSYLFLYPLIAQQRISDSASCVKQTYASFIL